jgi:hypothetical protein
MCPIAFIHPYGRFELIVEASLIRMIGRQVRSENGDNADDDQNNQRNCRYRGEFWYTH